MKGTINMANETFSVLVSVITYLENCAVEMQNQLINTEPKNHEETIAKKEHVNTLKEIVIRTKQMKKNLVEISVSEKEFIQEIDNSDELFCELQSVLGQLYRIPGLLKEGNFYINNDGKLIY